MKYISVCSGIEAASVAWQPLGWEPQFFSEIEKFPAAVLEHRHPNIPNLGDMTKFKEWSDYEADILVGGTPCQSFSVAGLRKGLDDPRGDLMLTYLAIADRYRPKWLVWENVPGVLSSNKGRDFGTFLGALAQLGYGFAYRVLDAQYFGVPQRRRRVFVVGYLGDWRRAAAVLFEQHSLQGHTPPGRKAGKEAAAYAVRCAQTSSNGCGIARELAYTMDQAQGQAVAYSITAREGKGPDSDCTTTLIPVTQYGDKAGTLTARHDSSACPDRGQNVVATPHVEATPTLRSGAPNGGKGHGARSGDSKDEYVVPVCSVIHGTQDPIVSVGRSHPLGRTNGQENAAFCPAEVGPTMGSSGPPYSRTGNERVEVEALAIHNMQVRRLTPVECDRLQGFLDNYTMIPWRNKPAESCPDGPRYKALGNSMAVPVMRWIGERIALVEKIK